MFKTEVVEKIKTHIFVFNDFFFSEDRDVYKINWEKYRRSEQATEVTISQRMRFACWITKARNTHSENAIRTALHGNKCCTNAS